MNYLLDKSAWVQSQYSKEAVTRLADLIRRGELALCTITALEILYSARNASEYDRDHRRLKALAWVDLPQPADAVELQRRLAHRGWHRTPIPDVMIAATAAAHDLTILHYDSDFERLAEVAGTGHEWIVPRGSGHRND